MRVGHHEGRHPGDATLAGMRVAGPDLVDVGVAFEKPCDHLPVEADGVAYLDKHIPFTYVPPLLEIGSEEPADSGGLAALDAGPVNEPVRIDRARRALDGFEIQREARRLGRLGDAGVDRNGGVLPAELRFEIGAPVHAAWGHVGVELERVPLDVEGVVGPCLERPVETGFADIAPRADRV